MKRVSLVMTLALYASVPWAADAPDDAQRVFALVAPSVVTVQTLDAQGKRDGHGSGVVVAPEQVVTNCHVVQEAAAIRVSTAQGEFAGVWTRQLADLDLCLLSVANLKASPVKLRPSTSLVVGESAFSVGNPLGFGLAVGSGLVAMAQSKTTPTALIATAPVSPGSSGGGLFDRQGQLLGITTAILGTGQNLNHVVAADGVIELLANGLPRPPAVVIPEPERRWDDEAVTLLSVADWVAMKTHAHAWRAAQPGAALPLVYLGIAEQNLGHAAKAIDTLYAALVLDPHQPLGWITLARVLFGQGKPTEVEQALRQGENAFPMDDLPQFDRASYLWKQGQAAQALPHAQEAIRKNPQRQATWTLLGQIEEQLGHSAQASRALATALRLDSADAVAKRRQTSQSQAPGRTGADARLTGLKNVSAEQESNALVNVALSELRVGHPGPAEDAARKAVALSPQSGHAWNALAAVHRTLNRKEEAEEALTTAIGLMPDNAVVYANRAETRLALKKPALAMADAQRATELDPMNSVGWRNAAKAKMELNDFRGANATYEKLASMATLSATDLSSWAESLLRSGRLDEASSTLQKAEVLDPKLIHLHLVRARLLGQKGDLVGALASENRVLEIDPVNAQAWSGKGYALIKLGKLLEAADALESAVRLDPTLANAWINLGEAQLRSRNLGRAIQALEKATSLAPGATDARMFLAQSYMGARLAAKSREQLEVVLQKQPDARPALAMVAMTYLMEGNTAAASPIYRKLQALAPNLAQILRNQAIAAGFLNATVWTE